MDGEHALHKNEKLKRLILPVCIFILTITSIVSGGWLAFKAYDYEASGSEYESVKESCLIPKEKPQPQESREVTKETWSEAYPKPPEVNWSELEGQGKQAVAWLEMPAAGISYPVMQGTDNTYYLNHTLSGAKRTAGSIFLDCENSPTFSDPNSIIYGHNMRDGTMFAVLNMIDDSQLHDCPYIWVCTKSKDLIYQVVSIHTEKASGDAFTLFIKDGYAGDEFLSWTQEQLEKSELEFENPNEHMNRILTLSTCTSNKSERKVVQAYLIKEYGH